MSHIWCKQAQIEKLFIVARVYSSYTARHIKMCNLNKQFVPSQRHVRTILPVVQFAVSGATLHSNIKVPKQCRCHGHAALTAIQQGVPKFISSKSLKFNTG